MTELIFREWLLKIDKNFASQNRKILLFVDNFSGHIFDVTLKNVKLAFFPPNCTSKLQPMDQGIIAWFKHNYRSAMIRSLVDLIDAEVQYEDVPQMTVWSAIDLIVRI